MRTNLFNKIKKIISEHIMNNSKEYIITFIFFMIGLFIGVMFFNNIDEEKVNIITTYFSDFIESLKTDGNINSNDMFKLTLKQNIIYVILIWFFGTTVIGIPVVLGAVIYKGFSLGYTISTIICTLGLSKGIIFIILALVLQNIILIPCIMAIAVSGLKLYKSIVKDKRKQNIKLEVVRHTIFSIIVLMLIIVSCLIEVEVSINLLKIFIKYF